ncbi:MAG: DUF2721 domain-containing protein [Thermomicrobiales bacterium]
MLFAFHPAEYMSAAVVPVVMISACGLLSLALYNRLAVIVARLRGLFRELAQEDALLGGEPDDAPLQRFVERLMERETGHVLRRARLVRGALVCLIACVLSMTLCSLTAGIASMWPAAAYLGLGLFVLGQVFLTVGLCLALRELWLALLPVEIESRAVEVIRERLLASRHNED